MARKTTTATCIDVLEGFQAVKCQQIQNMMKQNAVAMKKHHQGAELSTGTFFDHELKHCAMSVVVVPDAMFT